MRHSRPPPPGSGRAAGIRIGPALALLALLTGAALGQTAPREADLETVRRVVDALSAGDGPALAALADFDLRIAERIERGRATRPWADLDALDRQLEQREAADAWLSGAGHFVRAVSLVGARAVDDPDEGLGPVPDRRIVQAVLRRLVGGEHRDLLLTLSPDSRVLELEFGRPYYPGARPDGEAGLLPRPELALAGELEVRWPEDIDGFERGKLEELVDRLLALPGGEERDLVVEQLHRSARQAVAALLERLVVLDGAEAPIDVMARLDAALAHITGRPSRFRVAPRPGQDLAALRAQNRDAVQAWLRWQVMNGTRFVATDIVPPLDPTVGEKSDRGPTRSVARWDDGLGDRGRSDAGLSVARAEPAIVPEGPEDAAGTSSLAPEDLPPASAEPAEDPPPAAVVPRPGAPGTAPDTGPEVPPVSVDPTVDTPPGRGPSVGSDPPDPPAPPPTAAPTPPGRLPPERAVLFPAAADLELRFQDRSQPARAIEARLTPALKAALNAWAETARAMALDVLVADPPEDGLILLASCPRAIAREALQTLTRTHALLDDVLPSVPDAEADAVVAILLDEDGVERAWRPLLEQLVERRLLLGGQAERFASDPRGVLLRKVPLFLQPTWDIAGEGEFQLGNEVAHKAAQCLVTLRAGELPPNLLWGLGEFAEQRLFDTVYQFNTTGFVATADHFDWPQRTRQHIENRYRKAGFAFSAMALDDREAGTASRPQMVTWGLLAYLADKEPATLRTTLAELGALHAEADRSRRATVYRGDPERTQAVLQRSLDPVDPERVMTWLRGLR